MSTDKNFIKANLLDGFDGTGIFKNGKNISYPLIYNKTNYNVINSQTQNKFDTSNFATKFYEAAINAILWPIILHELISYFNANFCALIMADITKKKTLLDCRIGENPFCNWRFCYFF